MKQLSDDIIQFFQTQNFVVVSTIDKNGSPHSSCKGIVKINKSGSIYLFDLYKEETFNNLKKNPRISITAVDEHKFKGFCLKGKARTIASDKLSLQIVKAWEDKIVDRISQRVLRNIRGEKGHPRHPEALLPNPEYLIVMEVEDVVDLTPHPIK